MPIPIAEEGEKMDSFIHRCMEDKVMKDEFPVDNQRLAVCNTQWQKKEMSVYVELSEVEVFREGTSLPARERGLKRLSIEMRGESIRSLPARERGLKLSYIIR